MRKTSVLGSRRTCYPGDRRGAPSPRSQVRLTRGHKHRSLSGRAKRTKPQTRGPTSAPPRPPFPRRPHSTLRRLRAVVQCGPHRRGSAAWPGTPLPVPAALTLKDILHMTAAVPPLPPPQRNPARLRPGGALSFPPCPSSQVPQRGGSARRALPPRAQPPSPQTGPGGAGARPRAGAGRACAPRVPTPRGRQGGRSQPPLQPRGWERGTPFPSPACEVSSAQRACRLRRPLAPGSALSVPDRAGASCSCRRFSKREQPPPRRIRPARGAGGAVRAAHTRGCARSSRTLFRQRQEESSSRSDAVPQRPRVWALRLLPLLLVLFLVFCAAAREPGTAAKLSLHPPYFNLAEAARIWATATCGEREPGGERPRPELYCKLVGGPTAPGRGHAIQGQFCDYCNSEDPRRAHPVTNAIDGTERWWQSPPLSSGTQYNKVNVTLDLGQLFHVAYIIIKFANSPRPDLWVLERSVDFGSTYLPWQYFAHSKLDCLEQFGQEANRAVTRDDDVLCITEYSRIVPLENGEVVVSLINGRPGAKNFTFSHTLREFTKATNIRLRFLRTNTLLGHLISKAQRDPTVTRRYYYSIKDISIGGRCVCNGHAEVCNANNPEKLFQCECQHHTCGETCDRCCAGYNQRRWWPATSEQSNECEACNCHGHATDCYYDADVERQQASLNIHGICAGGGVCVNCQHNTAGINCEMCAKGYYRPHGVPADAPHGCIPCSCNPEHTDGCEQGSGHCYCKPNFRGDYCEECAVGYYSFPFCLRIPIFPISAPSPEDPVSGDIKGCECDLDGVLPEICARGRCLCRPGVEGSRCDTCRLGFYSFPICQACWCSALGSYQMPCSPVTGQCDCRPGVTGQLCDRCLSEAYDFPHCQECQCHVVGTVSGIGECGQGDGDCHCKPHVYGDSCDTCKDGYFALEKSNFFGCQGCQCDIGGALTPTCSRLSGACRCREHVVGKACQRPENNYYFPDLHHMKYEIEDGTTPDGRDIRFGFSPLEFPEFSWRGYAQMTSAQNEVRIMLNVGKSELSLFRVILRYINPGTDAVFGHIIIYPSRANAGQS
ncbi:laminin subunit alpha-3-like [Dugong dugon]